MISFQPLFDFFLLRAFCEQALQRCFEFLNACFNSQDFPHTLQRLSRPSKLFKYNSEFRLWFDVWQLRLFSNIDCKQGEKCMQPTLFRPLRLFSFVAAHDSNDLD